MFYSILESWAKFEISGLCGSNMQNFTLNWVGWIILIKQVEEKIILHLI
jgi:hypothetical protein